MKYFFWVWLLLLLPCPLKGGEEVFLAASQQMVDRAGAPMRGFLSSNNTYCFPVSLGEMSPWFIVAAVAAEDKRFYQHRGVDVQAIMRAFVQNAQQGDVVSGASTLTQQLVRAIEPRPKTWLGKITEAWQAVKLETNLSKEEILESYFNRVEFGNLTQGVQAASRFYFGVDAADVSLAQAAFLIGVVKSPTRYNPLKHFQRALKRRDYVLLRMLAEQLIDEDIYRLALQEPIVLKDAARPFEAPHFTRFLATLLPKQETYVRTTLDKELQLYTEQLVKNYIQKLTEDNVTNAAVIVLENATGAVLAYVGSADYYNTAHSGQVDGVRALRQPGSSLKPFVYGLAFEKQVLYPGELLADEDTFFEGGFRPRNYDESFHGLVSARQALACSYNIPAVKVAERIGTSSLLHSLHQAGFSELNRPADFYGLGLSLGNGEVQLLHLANAYATLARGGVYKPITLALAPLVQLPGKVSSVFSPQASYLVTHILADNQARAAAFGLNSALAVPFEFAAKTGTSKDYKDNFALGYTSRWTIGVWVGNFDATSMRRVSGVSGAGPILHDVAVYLQEKYPAPGFEQPAHIKRAQVCNRTGLLASPTCAYTHEEVFLDTHLPSVCTGKHQAASTTLKILSPKPGDIYQWDPSVPAQTQQLLWQASCPTACTWYLNAQLQATRACRVWWPLQVGKHRLEVVCEGEKTATSFEVLP